MYDLCTHVLSVVVEERDRLAISYDAHCTSAHHHINQRAFFISYQGIILDNNGYVMLIYVSIYVHCAVGKGDMINYG